MGLRSADDHPRGRRPDRRDPPPRPLHRRRAVRWSSARRSTTPSTRSSRRAGAGSSKRPSGRTTDSTSRRLAEVFAGLTAEGARTAYLLSNPHNPTGTVHTPAELEALARVADEHGVRVLSDEIHGPLVLPTSTFTPYLTVPGAERGVTVTSASKAWNLAGLKAAIIVPGDAAVDDVRRLHPFVTFGASHLGRHRADGGLPRRSRVAAPARRRAGREPAPARRPRRGAPARRSSRRARVDLSRVARPRRASASATTQRARCLRRARVALSPGPSSAPVGAGMLGSTTPRHPRSSATRSAGSRASLSDQESGPPLVALVVGPHGAYAVGPGVDEAWPLGDVTRASSRPRGASDRDGSCGRPRRRCGVSSAPASRCRARGTSQRRTASSTAAGGATPGHVVAGCRGRDEATVPAPRAPRLRGFDGDLFDVAAGADLDLFTPDGHLRADALGWATDETRLRELAVLALDCQRAQREALGRHRGPARRSPPAHRVVRVRGRRALPRARARRAARRPRRGRGPHRRVRRTAAARRRRRGTHPRRA